MIQWMLAIWSLVPLPFLNTAWTSGSSWFTYCWSLAWIILLACEMSAIVQLFEHSFHFLSLVLGGKHLFQPCGHCWVFQIFWHIEYSPFMASSFRIRISSISSPPLALFIVMLPKAHLTSHSRMSGSRWVNTSSWLSWSWRSFLYSSSVYSCHLILISSASVRSIPFLSFIVPIFARHVLLVSLIFLKKSLVFPILLFSSITLHWSLRKTFSSFFAILWNSAFRWVYLSFSRLLLASLIFTAIFKASSDYHFTFLYFIFLGMILITASYTMSWTSVHNSSGSLSLWSNPLSLFITFTV